MPVPEVWIRWPGEALRERPVIRAVMAEDESASARSVRGVDVSGLVVQFGDVVIARPSRVV